MSAAIASEVGVNNFRESPNPLTRRNDASEAHGSKVINLALRGLAFGL